MFLKVLRLWKDESVFKNTFKRWSVVKSPKNMKSCSQKREKKVLWIIWKEKNLIYDKRIIDESLSIPSLSFQIIENQNHDYTVGESVGKQQCSYYINCLHLAVSLNICINILILLELRGGVERPFWSEST